MANKEIKIADKPTLDNIASNMDSLTEKVNTLENKIYETRK